MLGPLEQQGQPPPLDADVPQSLFKSGSLDGVQLCFSMLAAWPRLPFALESWGGGGRQTAGSAWEIGPGNNPAQTWRPN